MPLVAEVLTTELIAGRQFEPGDFLIIKPGSYVRGMFELPQDLAQIVKVDQEGKIRFFYPDQRDQLARVDAELEVGERDDLGDDLVGDVVALVVRPMLVVAVILRRAVVAAGDRNIARPLGLDLHIGAVGARGQINAAVPVAIGVAGADDDVAVVGATVGPGYDLARLDLERDAMHYALVAIASSLSRISSTRCSARTRSPVSDAR